MSDPIESRLIEARRLRDAARGVLRSDIDTFRHGLTDRPIASRVRDQIIGRMADALDDGVALAGRNRLALGLGLGALAAWLFRKPLCRVGQKTWAWLSATVQRRRA
jgi:hypothetical protein